MTEIKTRVKLGDLSRRVHATCCYEAGFQTPEIRVLIRPLCWGLGASVSLQDKIPRSVSLQLGPVCLTAYLTLPRVNGFFVRKDRKIDHSVSLRERA